MSVTATPGVSRAARRPWRARHTAIAWLFLAPFAAVFVVFTAVPTLAALGLSVTDLQGADLRNPFAVDIVGLDNYVRLLETEAFRRAILNTLLFVVVGVPITMALGFLLALALDTGIRRFRGVLRAVFFAPVVTNIVAVALIWQYAFTREGVVNEALAAFGIGGENWLDDPEFAMPVVILLGVWRNFGTAMLLFLAGLQAVPGDVREAAALDGAGPLQRMWHITLPLLIPTILLVSVLLSVFYLQVFEEPYLLTDGGPLGSTESVALYTYHQFGFGKFGTSSAASFIMLVLVAVFALVQFRLLRPRS
jgi:multiple sugar transport system permease protein